MINPAFVSSFQSVGHIYLEFPAVNLPILSFLNRMCTIQKRKAWLAQQEATNEGFS